ncbi:inositol monophosphatase family protein [Cognatitamlana onchidii]|uniref:inositol monophosphatase family protein n=1 Tax=Cognatitamlana onchidii TaxID=2562860 RepID=UPI0010A5B5D0|nr:inositol monophosphatase family protein [Algibacter onchidii]
MILSSNNLETLCHLAIKAAKNAGEFIASYDKSQLHIKTKQTGHSRASQVVTEVDLKSQELILNVLEPSLETFDLGLLMEESPDNKSRFNKDYFWCIDPLDGTLSFTESESGYAVSIALITKNGIPVIGVVYDPVNHNLYHAIAGKGAFKNNHTWVTKSNTAISNLECFYNQSLKKHALFPHILEILTEVAKSNSLDSINLNRPNGAVMNACLAINQDPSYYFALPKKEHGGGSIWDYAATACIYKELGLHISDMLGNPLSLNNPNTTFMNAKGVLFSTNLNIASQFLAKFKTLI